jgi:NADH:ubiquinone oxidoreductase subunit 4 (subunit M)
MGAFLSLDLFLFFVMFEVTLVPMYFLIGGWGYGERVYAALKFFIFTMLGSAFMLVGIVSRRDVLQTFLRSDDEISREVHTELDSIMRQISVEKGTATVEEGKGRTGHDVTPRRQRLSAGRRL